MVESYCDESGINAGSPVCIVAGFFGGSNQWRSFEERWTDILRRVGLEEFHARDFWARDQDGGLVGTYRGWSQEKARSFLDELVDVGTSVKIYPVSCAVVAADWEKVPEEQRRYVTGAKFRRSTQKHASTGAPTQPYFLCFQWCVHNAAKYCRPHLKIDFFFDLNKQLDTHAKAVWAQMKDDTRSPVNARLGELRFPTSSERAGLQLADLLAYLAQRYARRKLENWSEEPSGLLRRLLRNAIASDDFPFLSEKAFAEWNSTFPEYLRRNLSQTTTENLT
jgi:hypothetical protein